MGWEGPGLAAEGGRGHPETRNTDGASAEAFKAAIAFIEEEMREEHGSDIKNSVDVVGAEYLYLPPSGDALVNIEATMGIAKVFHVLGWATAGP